MKKMQLLLMCTMLSFAQSIFASMTVWNRSNQPIYMTYTTKASNGKDSGWTPSIAPGATAVIPSVNTWYSFNIIYLTTGTFIGTTAATSAMPTSSQVLDGSVVLGGRMGGSGPTFSSTPQSVIVYGDGTTAATATISSTGWPTGQTAAPLSSATAGVTAAGNTVVTVDAGAVPPTTGATASAPGTAGQCLLGAGSLSRFAAFITGTVTSGVESSGATQPIIVQTINAAGAVVPIAYVAPTGS